MAEVSIEQIVARAKAQLGLTDSSCDLFLELQINEAVRSLDSLGIFDMHQVTLDVENLQAKLPCGFYKLIAAKVHCGDDWTSSMFYVNTPFLSECGCDVLSPTPYYYNTFKIIGNYLHFVSTNTDITQITLAYYGLKTSSESPDLWYIDEDYERALWNYAAWQYCETHNLPVKSYKGTWKAQKKWIRGNAQQLRWDNDKWKIMNTVFNQVYISPKIW